MTLVQAADSKSAIRQDQILRCGMSLPSHSVRALVHRQESKSLQTMNDPG